MCRSNFETMSVPPLPQNAQAARAPKAVFGRPRGVHARADQRSAPQVDRRGVPEIGLPALTSKSD